jgi:hypothetical protein
MNQALSLLSALPLLQDGNHGRARRLCGRLNGEGSDALRRFNAAGNE